MSDPSRLPAIKTPWDSASPTDTAGAYGTEKPPIPVPDHAVLRRIGRGAYGEVWLARNALGQYRAVKIVHRKAFDSDRPFEREFAGIQRFEPISRSHESQLNILHVGRGPDYFYYVMELADDMGRGPAIDEGSYAPRTLRSELHLRGRLPVEECVRLGLALTTALENLHRHGLVHRDIKPSNIVFVNGIPKLADIGLVAQAERTMSFVGTEGYLPPEGPGTVQADVFSLGKVLYEIATGHDRQQFPDLPTQVEELPDRHALAEFNEVLLRSCAPDPKQRYQTAAEMHADLALLQSGKSIARMRWVERRLRFLARAGAVVSGIAALAGLAFVYQRMQTKEARRLAEENQRLAVEARNNERAARENLYAADINLAQQALLAGNLRQALPLLEAHVPQPGHPDLRGFEWRYLWEQCRGDELLSLPGRSRDGRALAFSPDGKRLAAAWQEGRIRVWQSEAWKEIGSWEVGSQVRNVSWSPDGNLIAVASIGGASIWDARDGALSRRLPAPGQEARFSPAGHFLVTRSEEKLVLWNTGDWSVAASHRLQEPLPEASQAEPDSRVAFSPDGTLLAVVLSDSVRFFRIPGFDSAGALQLARRTGASSAPLVQFSPDGRTIATLGDTGLSVRLWDIASLRPQFELAPHGSDVLGAKFSPDGKRLATCSADQSIQLWDLATGRRLRTLQGQGDEVLDVAFAPDGRLLASIGTYDGAVKLWDLEAAPRPEFFREPIGPVGFAPSGVVVAVDAHLNTFEVDPITLKTSQTAASALTPGRAYVARFGVRPPASDAPGKPLYVPHLGNLSSDGDTVALWERPEERMDVWSLRDRRLLCSVAALKPWVTFAPKRMLFATDTTNATTTVWQLPSGALKWVFTNRVGLFQAIAFSPDENYLVTDEGTIMKLWRIEGEAVKLERSFNAKRSSVIGMAWSPDGRLLATGEESGPIKLWSMPSGEEAGVLKGHTRSVLALAFSREGRTLASMCDDLSLRLWQVSTRRELLRFLSPIEDHSYFNLAFSSDGRALAARRVDDQEVRTWVWHAPSFEEITRLEKAP